MYSEDLKDFVKLSETRISQISNGTERLVLTGELMIKFNKWINIHLKKIENELLFEEKEKFTQIDKECIPKIIKLLESSKHIFIRANSSDEESDIDLSIFKELNILQLMRIDINKVKGLSSLRIQLQQLDVSFAIDNLKCILEDCGGDFSSRSIWSELKNLALTYNHLTTLDSSLECAPWLVALDLSHNELINVDEVNCLSNLKHLNLSFNKFTKLPKFSGQICNRLQVLNINNNFIEDITELKKLENIADLDLSYNCLIDHQVLIYLSHLATLQWLSLIGNPLSYHYRHRQNTAVYIHSNIEVHRFILDNEQLRNNEIKYIGTFHPLMQKSNSETINTTEDSMKFLASADRSKKIREVDIEDNKSVEKLPVILPNSYSSIDHLEMKNHIQNLRETYGESWLNYYRGVRDKNNSINNSQDISGFALFDETVSNGTIDNVEDMPPEVDNTLKGDNLETNIYNTTAYESSEEDDIEVNSEETIYMAKIDGEDEDLFVVFTKDALTEIDCTTSKERANWVVNTIINCEFIEDSHTKIQINFDTLRKDRKQRIYVLQLDDAERLFNFITKIINNRKKPSLSKVFQCMKCMKQFSKNEDLMASYKEEVNACPGCGSTIVIEENIQIEHE